MVDLKKAYKWLELGEKILSKVKEKAGKRGPPTVRDRKRERSEVRYR